MNAFGRPLQPIDGVTAEQFREEIQTAGRPALLRGLVEDWPAVRAGRAAPREAATYIRRYDRGMPVDTNFGAREIGGRFFYNERLDGLNFTRKSRTIGGSMERILGMAGRDHAQAIYIQSVPVGEHLPGFEMENRLPLAPEAAEPRIWIGNRAVVQAHFDLKENIACVVAGRRRFTLFPPEQTPNLYPGPFELTLAGPPVSMVDLAQPDLQAHPRFREAMETAVVAEMQPGDALYIPYFWWHHVEALDDFNVLVNYWWNDADPALGNPFDALLHALLSLRDLPERQRRAWQALFDLYVFGAHGDPLAHLPESAHGTLGRHDPDARRRIRMILMNALAEQAGIRTPGHDRRKGN